LNKEVFKRCLRASRELVLFLVAFELYYLLGTTLAKEGSGCITSLDDTSKPTSNLNGSRGCAMSRLLGSIQVNLA
jgi:hypothetical protein